MKNFACPCGWSIECEDELEGYLRLYYHQDLDHHGHDAN